MIVIAAKRNVIEIFCSLIFPAGMVVQSGFIVYKRFIGHILHYVKTQCLNKYEKEKINSLSEFLITSVCNAQVQESRIKTSYLGLFAR